MKTTEDQRTTLQKFVEYATAPKPGQANFGAMLMISPVGDVTFLTPVVPELRGVEIVSPVDDTFDIWRAGNLVGTNFTAAQTLAWLRKMAPQRAEADYKQHIAKWAEDTMRHYRVPTRP